MAEPIGARFQQLDVTDPDSVDAFVAPIDRLDLLVNNAGGALGVDRIEAASDERWRTMWEVNFLGLARMTRALLPALLASGEGHVVNVGSIAGFETYPGGAGYTGAKHAVRALTKTLRVELVGKPIRVTEICPGLVETEFSMVRFDQDAEKAAAVYNGMTPLSSEDVADCIVLGGDSASPRQHRRDRRPPPRPGDRHRRAPGRLEQDPPIVQGLQALGPGSWRSGAWAWAWVLGR